MLAESLKTIGFGLFINGSYALMNNDLSLSNIYITIGSFFSSDYRLPNRKKEQKMIGQYIAVAVVTACLIIGIYKLYTMKKPQH